MTSKAQAIFERARKEQFAIGAFNAASIETLKAIAGAAKNLSSPVMVEASSGEVSYFGLSEMVSVVRAMEKDYEVPILLNLDHAADLDSCKRAVDAGFDYVHLDGSKMSLAQNTQMAKELVDYAHSKGVMVEGEIDNINIMGASSADHRNENISLVRNPTVYTDPQKASEFVNNTGIDTFASFIGNVHGLYSQEKTLDLPLLQRISAGLPGKFLSLHGGSGIPAGDVRAAIDLGIVKINVNSELRIAFRDKLKEVINGPEGDEVAIYKIMPAAIEAMQKIVEDKIKLFGSAGKI